MLETWWNEAPLTQAHSTSAEVPNELRRIVLDSLKRELDSRRGRAPHVQLGVVVGADDETVERAYMRLAHEFDPNTYTRHGREAVALAREIRVLIEGARIQLRAAPKAPAHFWSRLTRRKIRSDR
jgi:hypothetical protein